MLCENTYSCSNNVLCVFLFCLLILLHISCACSTNDRKIQPNYQHTHTRTRTIRTDRRSRYRATGQLHEQGRFDVGSRLWGSVRCLSTLSCGTELTPSHLTLAIFRPGVSVKPDLSTWPLIAAPPPPALTVRSCANQSKCKRARQANARRNVGEPLYLF